MSFRSNFSCKSQSLQSILEEISTIIADLDQIDLSVADKIIEET
jgi:hypothetical protein